MLPGTQQKAHALLTTQSLGKGLPPSDSIVHFKAHLRDILKLDVVSNSGIITSKCHCLE